jgi:hypothetical protein
MGGTSFLDGGFSNIAATAGTRSGNGLITINFIGVPEPSTWAFLLLGFAGIGAALRRRRERPDIQDRGGVKCAQT